MGRHHPEVRLYSPNNIGQSVTVTPKRPYLHLRPGTYYIWKMVEPGVGLIEGEEMTAEELLEHFVIKEK